MFRKLLWVACLSLCVFILMTVLGIIQNTGTRSKAVSSIESQKSTSTNDVMIKTRVIKTNTYTITISTPFTKNEKLNQDIKQWIKEQENDFLAKMKKLPPDENHSYLNIDAKETKAGSSIYSLVFESTQIVGSMKGHTTIKTFTIDSKHNKVLLLSDLVKKDKLALNYIESLTNTKVNNLSNNKKKLTSLKKELENKKNWNWSLSKEAFILHLNKNDLMDDATGTIAVKIPFEKIQVFLNENIAELLAIPDSASKNEQESLDPNGKYVALTFDDGPHPKVTPKILKTLRDHHAKATFFMLGNQIKHYPSVAKNVAESGHEIGNHSVSHPFLSKLNAKQIQHQIEDTNLEIVKKTGECPTYFRPPYGDYNKVVEAVSVSTESPLILWSVDSRDWQIRNSKSIHKRVLDNVVSGSIVLMHDIHPSTADALPSILESLEKEGYQFITVSELLSLQEKKPNGPYYGKVKS